MYSDSQNSLLKLPFPSNRIKHNTLPEELIEDTLSRGQGVLSDTGALCVQTGAFTGRSPKDRFLVRDELTENTVDWNKFNIPFTEDKFDQLQDKITQYMSSKELYVQDLYACADPSYRLNIRLVAEYPWSALFANNMFRRPERDSLDTFHPDWTIYCAPGFTADPEIDGTRQGNFAVVNFTKKMILIGGTGYTGEIKKGIFSVLNYLLPTRHGVLAMHCSANVGHDKDTAIFFGLSGTGKTTLSADPDRMLIGDDEHGWSDKGIFNFEGGCYAKTIDLTEEKEPDIYRAICHGAILENIVFNQGTRTPDYKDASITQNTRVSYPLHHIENATPDSQAGMPSNVFFLTADAFGVLPPISKLTPAQAMYHFISGYTAKVAGTEEGVTEPQATFSACFGAPFMPLHPAQYADMLGKKMREHKVNVWLVNTGWTGGPYGVGSRIKLKYTRAMITAALNGSLATLEFVEHPVTMLHIPTSCPGVPSELLDPVKTWADADAYHAKADQLAEAFIKNFEKYADGSSEEILSGAPVVRQTQD